MSYRYTKTRRNESTDDENKAKKPRIEGAETSSQSIKVECKVEVHEDANADRDWDPYEDYVKYEMSWKLKLSFPQLSSQISAKASEESSADGSEEELDSDSSFIDDRNADGADLDYVLQKRKGKGSESRKRKKSKSSSTIKFKKEDSEEFEEPPGTYGRIAQNEFDLFKLDLPKDAMPPLPSEVMNENQCGHCNQTFSSWILKMEHIVASHDLPVDTLPYLCPVDQKPLSLSDIVTHAKQEHSFQGNDLENDFANNTFVDRQTLEKVTTAILMVSFDVFNTSDFRT